MTQLAIAKGVSERAARRATRGGGTERAYRHLRELIVWGQLAPGSRIVESDVALRLAISRTPVRSALRRLLHEGYLIPIGRRKEQRLVVAPLTQVDARELFDMVGMVEGLAARNAARVPPQERQALCKKLASLDKKIANVAGMSSSTSRLLFDADMRFHRCYVEAGAGSRLLALHDAIKPQAERYIHLYTNSLLGEIGRSMKDHDEIIERIADGKALEARRAVQRSWRKAASRVKQLIAMKGERGTW